MNLYRDQLDRHGELEQLADRWERLVAELPATSTPVLNADDPAIAALGGARAGVLTFGIDDPSVALPGGLPHAADSTRCRACSAPLVYDLVILGHLGHWRCPSCEARRPRPTCAPRAWSCAAFTASRSASRPPRGRSRPSWPSRRPQRLQRHGRGRRGAGHGRPSGLHRARPGGQPGGLRAGAVRLDGRELVLLLAKNPTGANETVRTILLDPEPPHLLIALNDRTADGNDVSSIWDVDDEPLLARAASLTLTGDRPTTWPCACATRGRGRRAPGPPRPRQRPRRSCGGDARGRHPLRPPPTRPCWGCGRRWCAAAPRRRSGVSDEARAFALEHAHYPRTSPSGVPPQRGWVPGARPGVRSGRVALPLARDGAEVSALDRSPAMRAELERLLGAEPRGGSGAGRTGERPGSASTVPSASC